MLRIVLGFSRFRDLIRVSPISRLYSVALGGGGGCRPSDRAEVRRDKYKAVVDAEEGRRRTKLEIRKNRQEGMLALPQFQTTHTSAMYKSWKAFLQWRQVLLLAITTCW